jgi:regulator of protease activity HflC (stomatin/prohibitin superfamily)
LAVRRLPTRPNPAVIAGGAALALLVLLGIVFSASGAQVNAGSVGVLITFGRVDGPALQPGFHMLVPGVQHIVPINIQKQNHVFREIDAASKELQTVKLFGGVNYHIDPAQAPALYQNVGLDYASKVFDPAFQDFIKEVVPQFPVTDILSHRDEIRAQTKSKLIDTAHRYGIEVDDVFITDITFSAEYTKAIEAKQVAQQQLEQAKIDAQKAVTQAQGQANAQIESAKGDSESNRLRSQNLSADLIAYLEIQKWDGKLPQATSGQPFISLTPR